jgi:hypothetical protein
MQIHFNVFSIARDIIYSDTMQGKLISYKEIVPANLKSFHHHYGGSKTASRE